MALFLLFLAQSAHSITVNIYPASAGGCTGTPTETQTGLASGDCSLFTSLGLSAQTFCPKTSWNFILYADDATCASADVAGAAQGDSSTTCQPLGSGQFVEVLGCFLIPPTVASTPMQLTIFPSSAGGCTGSPTEQFGGLQSQSCTQVPSQSQSVNLVCNGNIWSASFYNDDATCLYADLAKVELGGDATCAQLPSGDYLQVTGCSGGTNSPIVTATSYLTSRTCSVPSDVVFQASTAVGVCNGPIVVPDLGTFYAGVVCNGASWTVGTFFDAACTSLFRAFNGTGSGCNADGFSVSGCTACSRSDPNTQTLPIPDSISSVDGTLEITMYYRDYNPAGEAWTHQRCFEVENNGQVLQSPTLRVNPGDHIILNLVNQVPPADVTSQLPVDPSKVCGETYQDLSSINLHFHGFSMPAICHEDEVAMTLVNSGNSFTYDFHVASDQGPGLYWYHPHVPYQSDFELLAGSPGLIVVAGLENVHPSHLSGVVERQIVIRDQNVDPSQTIINGRDIPGYDLSVNYVPILYSNNYAHPSVVMQPGEQELWRVINAGADSDLIAVLLFDNVPQAVGVLAIDGVPLAKQTLMSRLPLAPGSRYEILVTAPHHVVNATFATLRDPTGIPGVVGDNMPPRPIVQIELSDTASNTGLFQFPRRTRQNKVTNWNTTADIDRIMAAEPANVRSLTFSENADPTQGPVGFFVTLQGQQELFFNRANPPTLTATIGTVEDWTVSNTAFEEHEFHIHQIHFINWKTDGVTVPDHKLVLMDTIRIPAWPGYGDFPSVTLRMDFSGDIAGDAVYHCHILSHEDAGMMAGFTIVASNNS